MFQKQFIKPNLIVLHLQHRLFHFIYCCIGMKNNLRMWNLDKR